MGLSGPTICCNATRDVSPVFLQCWADVFDGGPTLKKHGDASGDCRGSDSDNGRGDEQLTVTASRY